VDTDTMDELLDVCELYVTEQVVLLHMLGAGADPEIFRHASQAQLDQLTTAVRRARADRPCTPYGDPGE
jgi:hypothetical protein